MRGDAARRRPVRATVLAGASLLVALLGVLDYATGTELSFAVFYVMPIAWAAWEGRRRVGILFSVLGAATWHVTNLLAGAVASHPAIPYWNTATRLAFFLIITHLIARRREAFDAVTRHARTDMLTGALNGRAFQVLVEVELERCRRHGRPFTLVYADIDDFKIVNDTRGHAEGDEVLRLVAAELGRALRTTDALARLGGDEFAMLLVETNAADAALGVDRVRRRVEQVIGTRGWPVTLSMGVVTCETAPASVDALIALADRQMYEAKAAGKSRSVITVLADRA